MVKKVISRDDDNLRIKTKKKIEQLKQIQTVQAKIDMLIQTPSKVPEKNSDGEPLNPRFYNLLQYYFERIPSLKKFRPTPDFGNFTEENLNLLFTYMKESRHIQHDIRGFTLLPYSEHRMLFFFDKEFKFTFDSIKLEKAKSIEHAVKEKFVKRMVEELKNKHEENMIIYLKDVGEFVKENKKTVNEERTR